jgi:hypothetical protein
MRSSEAGSRSWSVGARLEGKVQYDWHVPYLKDFRAFRAGFPGKCRACLEAIIPGQFIQPAGPAYDAGYHHLRCDQPDASWVRPDQPREPAFMESIVSGTVLCTCEHPKAGHPGGEGCELCGCVWYQQAELKS